MNGVTERELADQHGVVHFPTVWWYKDGKRVREYPEDATRFDGDLTKFMLRQLAPAGPLMPEGNAATWVKEALHSRELNVFGHFSTDDDPLLLALRRAVLLREYVSAAYTSKPEEYASVAEALQVGEEASKGEGRPLVIVKPFDERVVLVPTKQLNGLPYNEMVDALG